MHFRGMLNAPRVAIVIVNNGESQFFNLVHNLLLLISKVISIYIEGAVIIVQTVCVFSFKSTSIFFIIHRPIDIVVERLYGLE